MPVKDSLIAFTALAHGLTVATRNRRDFAVATEAVVIRSRERLGCSIQLLYEAASG